MGGMLLIWEEPSRAGGEWELEHPSCWFGVGTGLKKGDLTLFLLGFLAQDTALRDPCCSVVRRHCKSPCFPHGFIGINFFPLLKLPNNS